MKTEHPILFSSQMVRAIMGGHKTQTRRVITEKDCCDPRWQVGDLLWVRESWRTTGGGNWYGIAYKASEDDGDARAYVGCKRDVCLTVPQEYMQQWEHYVYGTNRSCNWRSSIHMPKWACRLWLRLKVVRVERIQDISEDDAKAEGIKGRQVQVGIHYHPETIYPAFPQKEGGFASAREAFEVLWDSINAKRGYGWEVNPRVWVIEFEKSESVKSVVRVDQT